MVSQGAPGPELKSCATRSFQVSGTSGGFLSYFRPASAPLALDLNLNVSGIQPKARSCPSDPDSILSSQVDAKMQGNGDDSLSCLHGKKKHKGKR